MLPPLGGEGVPKACSPPEMDARDPREPLGPAEARLEPVEALPPVEARAATDPEALVPDPRLDDPGLRLC